MLPGRQGPTKGRSQAEVMDLVQGVELRDAIVWSNIIFLDRSLFLQTPSQELRASQAITQARTLSVLAAFSERNLFTDNDRHRHWAPADIYSRVAFSCQSFLNKACHLKMARSGAPLFYLALFLSLAPARFFHL